MHNISACTTITFLQSNELEKNADYQNFPKYSIDEDNKCFYKEVSFRLANTEQTVKMSYYEHFSLLNKTCQIHIISSEEFIAIEEIFMGDTLEEAEDKCLKRIAYLIEKSCGVTIGCNSGDKDIPIKIELHPIVSN